MEYKRKRTIRRSDPKAGLSLLKRRSWHIDVTITAADVLEVAGSATRAVDGGAAGLVAGKLVYEDGTNGLKLADAGAVATADVVGMLLNGGGIGQPLKVVTGGDVTVSAVLTIGVRYVLSDTAGGLAPNVDVGSAKVGVFIGIATTTTNLKLGILNSGVLAT